MVQAMLLPMNFSSRWIDKAQALIPEIARKSYAINDPYAIQNLMESLNTFTPFADELDQVSCPTLIVNGEFDYLTPRVCHETLRAGIRNSRLVIIQHGYHAITLEFPELTARLFDAFVRHVQAGDWPGDQSAWVASEDFPAEVLAYRCFGDHLRAVQAVDAEARRDANAWLLQPPAKKKADAKKTVSKKVSRSPAPAAAKPKSATQAAAAIHAKRKPSTAASAKPAKTAGPNQQKAR